MDDSLDERLYPVQFIHLVEGRGLTAHCSFPAAGQMVFRQGDRIEFIRPDKSTFPTWIRAISAVYTAGDRPGLIGIVLPDSVDQEEVPFGSIMRVINEN